MASSTTTLDSISLPATSASASGSSSSSSFDGVTASDISPSGIAVTVNNNHENSTNSPNSDLSPSASASASNSSSSASVLTPSSSSVSNSSSSNSSSANFSSSSPHVLHRVWTLWYKEPPKNTNQNDWGDSVKSVVDISSVEQFWSIFNHIIPPSQLPNKGDYHLFEKGVFPKWEDEINKRGGEWVVEFKRNEGDETPNRAWIITILSLIGEVLDDSLHAVGAVISIRKGKAKLQIWTREATKRDSVMNIGKHWKRLLTTPFASHGNNIGAGLRLMGPMGYISHEEVLKSQHFQTYYTHEL